MDDLARQICQQAHNLDEVQFKAFLTTIAALSAGMGNVAALVTGNIVLASAGYPPTPYTSLKPNERKGSGCKPLPFLLQRRL